MEEKQFIHDIVAEKADIIAGINRAVWDYAEFGYQEDQSAEKIKAVLRRKALRWKKGWRRSLPHLWGDTEAVSLSLEFWPSMMLYRI